MPFDVCVVGAIGIDTTVYLHGTDIDFNIESNFSHNVDNVGQAGGFCSKLLSSLGYKTAFIGFVGNDYHGHLIRKELKEQNVDAEALFIDPKGTKRSINFMYLDGRRKNFYDGKGSMVVRPDIERCKNILKESKIAHFNIPNWARYLLPTARDAGNIISCDIQDAYSLTDEYREDFIRYADILFFSGVNFENPMEIVKQLSDRYPSKIIICGMGSRGCCVYACKEIKQYDRIEMPKPVVDTNGAGDSLAMGFLTSYCLEKFDIPAAVLRGQLIARHLCSFKNPGKEFLTSRKLNHLFNVIRQNI